MRIRSSFVALLIILYLMFGASMTLAAPSASPAKKHDIGTDQSVTEKPGYFNSFTLYWENDFFAGTDRDYTNGIKMTWATAYGELEESNLPVWSHSIFNWLPFVNKTGGKRAVTLSVGQDIYTPEDTASTQLVIDDRPYAGRTYVAAGFHTRRAQRKDSWEVSIGIVGPASLAQQTQDLFHDMIGSENARGWDNQLNNELTIDAICESKWRTWSSSRDKGLNFDLIPHLGGRLGTVQTYLNTGAEIRIGKKLPNDFGSCPIRAGCETSTDLDGGKRARSNLHFFLAADAKAVARDIFLDGNTFTNSHSVDKETFVGEFMGGLVWQMGRVKTTYSYIYRTQQFDTQKSDQVYGSLSLTWAY